jgi:hypothetical protein
VLYTIVWENFVYLLKIVSILQGYYIRRVMKDKIYFILYYTSVKYILYLRVCT